MKDYIEMGEADSRVIEVDKILFEERERYRTEGDYSKSPICETCFRQDYLKKGSVILNDLNTYRNMRHVKDSKPAKVHSRKETDPVLKKEFVIFRDWECPNGHKMSIEIAGEDYKEAKK